MVNRSTRHLSLTDAEKALLKQWVTEGADYKPHWSLLPVGTVAVPAARAASATILSISAAELAPAEPVVQAAGCERQLRAGHDNPNRQQT